LRSASAISFSCASTDANRASLPEDSIAEACTLGGVRLIFIPSGNVRASAAFARGKSSGAGLGHHTHPPKAALVAAAVPSPESLCPGAVCLTSRPLAGPATSLQIPDPGRSVGLQLSDQMLDCCPWRWSNPHAAQLQAETIETIAHGHYSFGCLWLEKVVLPLQRWASCVLPLLVLQYEPIFTPNWV
jgi:hypothetical protein